jgi:HSP20 family protein
MGRRITMANLVRRENQFRNLFDCRQDMDEPFNRMLGWSPGSSKQLVPVEPEAPPVEAWVDKDGKTYHLRVSLPGIEPENVELNIQGNTLSICGEREESRETKDVDYLCREIGYGRVDRTLTLPEGVATDKISAEYNNGLLEITAPIAAAALPRRVEIKVGKSQAAGA